MTNSKTIRSCYIGRRQRQRLTAATANCDEVSEHCLATTRLSQHIHLYAYIRTYAYTHIHVHSQSADILFLHYLAAHCVRFINRNNNHTLRWPITRRTCMCVCAYICTWATGATRCSLWLVHRFAFFLPHSFFVSLSLLISLPLSLSLIVALRVSSFLFKTR